MVIEDTRTNIFLSYRNSQDMEDEEEEDEGGQRDISEGFSDLSQSPPSGGGGPLKNFTGSIHFKSFDSVDQESHSSSISNAVDITSTQPEEGQDYQPLSPFGTSPIDLELGGMGETGTHTPVGSLTNTPSPLELCKPFPPLRPRKSSSLSNVLDDASYGTDPPTGDTISNTSNPQVYSLQISLLQAKSLWNDTSTFCEVIWCLWDVIKLLFFFGHLVLFEFQQTPEEELCNLLTNIIFSVLWSGSWAEGAEDVVWRERGQVFSVLTKLGSSCQLVRLPDEIKRRLVM